MNCETCNHDGICANQYSDSYGECCSFYEPLRLSGDWIRFRDEEKQPEHIKCSVCGQYWSIADHDKIFRFCFHCGAKMWKGTMPEG